MGWRGTVVSGLGFRVEGLGQGLRFRVRGGRFLQLVPDSGRFEPSALAQRERVWVPEKGRL